MLQLGTKGKIIINVEKIGEKVNSSMELKGIAKQQELVLTTLLINFASLSIENNKNPEALIDKHLKSIIEMIKQDETIKKRR
jgi:hypothetical protein